MICSIYTPSRPVTEVQMWLRALAQRKGIHPLPAVDGVYSEDTANAVRCFQSAHGLPATGVVDFATWTAIRKAYEPVCACAGLPGPLYVQCPDLELGAAGSYIFILQALLNTLSPHFGNFTPVAYTGEYDTSTRERICCIQKCSGLPDGGRVDRLTWNALATLYNSSQGTPLAWRLSEQSK